MQIRNKLYIDGEWVTPAGSETIDVINPATEDVIGRIPQGTHREVDAAVAAARRAFEPWSRTSPALRGSFLQRIRDALEARADELGRVITAEVGMPLKLSARIQVGLPVANIGHYAKLAATFRYEERVGNSVVVREPVGVVACITPWNYPLHQIVAKVAPALAAGCTVVLKPSEVAPLNAFVLAEVIASSGLPAGVFNLIAGNGPGVGEALAGHPDVDMVSFTGSTRAGKRISEVAAQTVKRVALELGGKSAALILDDAELATAVKATVNACYLNSGQTCAAYTRMLVSNARYREAIAIAVDTASRFTVGDPLAERTKLGPLVSAAQRDRVLGYMSKGIADGAELLSRRRGAARRAWRRDTTSSRQSSRTSSPMTIAQEEIFGPVLCIIRYDDEDEAVAIANGTPYGLAGAVWAGSDARAEEVARRLRAGQVEVNGGQFNLLAPFGGFKQSGHGREMGTYGMEEFLDHKALQLRAHRELPELDSWAECAPGEPCKTSSTTGRAAIRHADNESSRGAERADRKYRGCRDRGRVPEDLGGSVRPRGDPDRRRTSLLFWRKHQGSKKVLR